MIEAISLMPGVTLRCCPDHRFKQGTLTLQLLRPMCREEAALNALIPAILLRGTASCPDLRAITLRLDDLYGAGVGPLVRRVGNCQTTGFSCSFLEDRFAMPGDRVLEPMAAFLGELLLCPRTENGRFVPEIVESEKNNLISAIESEINEKRIYAMNRLLEAMCRGDSFGVPRLGWKEQATAITPETAWAHYRRILKESPIALFYVGSAPAQFVAEYLEKILGGIPRSPVEPPEQTPLRTQAPEGQELREHMDVTQARLCMGFTTPITNRDSRFAAMQVANAVLGGGMTSKLFRNVRERMSLCYAIGSAYYGAKGVVTVSAGIDPEQEPVTRQEILRQLDQVATGQISEEELNAAREAILSTLRTVTDSPGAIEGYYGVAAISGLNRTAETYAGEVAQVTAEQAAEAAATLRLHTTYILEGVKA